MELWGTVSESLDLLRSHSIIRAYGPVIYSQVPEALLQQAPVSHLITLDPQKC